MTRALLLITLLCAGSVLAATGCDDDDTNDPLPWGSCGPAELAKAVPPEVYTAAQDATQPGGTLAPGEFLGCDEAEETTFGEAYLTGYLDAASADAEQDDLIVFSGEYLLLQSCDGEATNEVTIWFNEGAWEVAGGGGSGAYLKALEEALPDNLADCTRGLFMITSMDMRFAVITDEVDGILIYSLGELVDETPFTKDEFLTWWHDVSG